MDEKPGSGRLCADNDMEGYDMLDGAPKDKWYAGVRHCLCPRLMAPFASQAGGLWGGGNGKFFIDYWRDPDQPVYYDWNWYHCANGLDQWDNHGTDGVNVL
jgi:hypothetical protein